MAVALRRPTQVSILLLGLMLVVIPVCSFLLPQASRAQLADVYSRVPVTTLATIGVCLVVVFSVCLWLAVRMRAASVPLISLILMISGWVTFMVSAGAAQNASRQQSETFRESPVTRLVINGGVSGIRVFCNGIDLGVTPIDIAIDEFTRRVPQAEFPPEQPGVDIDQAPNRGGFRYVDANWTQIPSGLRGQEVFGFGTHNEPESVIMKRLASIEYWWSFRSEGSIGRLSRMGWSQHNEVMSLTSKLQWAEAKEHARLLAILAKDEGVDARVAYAEHLRNFAPPLRMYLNQRYAEPEEPQSHASDIAKPFGFEQYSSTPLSFDMAVYRDDLRWIVRSNDPRSIPLIRRHLDTLYQRYRSHDSVLTFGSGELALMSESELVEVADLLKEVLQHADWTDTATVKKFVSQQIAHGADRVELQTWVSSLNLATGHIDTDLIELLVRIGSDGFENVTASVSYSDLLRVIQTFEFSELRPAVVQWLVGQWEENPTKELLNVAESHPNLEPLIDALRDTQLETVEQVKALFLSVWNRESQHRADSVTVPVVDDAVTDAVARALRTSGGEDAALNSQFARLLEAIGTLKSLQALTDAVAQYETEGGPLTKSMKSLNQRLAWDAKRRQEDLQLARDLIAGRKSPENLIETTDFVWKDGRYDVVEAADANSEQ